MCMLGVNLSPVLSMALVIFDRFIMAVSLTSCPVSAHDTVNVMYGLSVMSSSSWRKLLWCCSISSGERSQVRSGH